MSGFDGTTIDSNVTGARIAEEALPCVLPGEDDADGNTQPGTPVWDAAEPNSYSDFGGQNTTTARSPINPTRQRKKGTSVDFDASGGYNQDFTETGLLKLMQGFLFADARQKPDTQSFNGTAVPITSTTMTSRTIAAASGLDVFAEDDLVMLTGFGNAATNGLKLVATAAAGAITLDASTPIGASEASPPVSARVQKVGVRVPGSDLEIIKSGNQVQLQTTTLDLTTLGLVEGEWIALGDDFTTPANQNVYARCDVITANLITLGKTSKTMVAEAAPTTVDIYLGTVVRNEPNPDDITRRTYQIERTLGRDDNGVQSEYLLGSMANEFTLNNTTAELINADLAFIAADYTTRDGATGVKAGTRPALPTEDAFNATTDVRRARLSTVVAGDPNPSALFAYATDYTIVVNNNISPNKAIGVRGAISMAVGEFAVSGSLEVYFSTVAAIEAVNQNQDVTFDVIMAKNNVGWVFDIPLLALGDGRLNVEANQAIKVPLEQNAAESELGYTMLTQFFPYLPDGL